MHRFLRSIGFTNAVSPEDQDSLLKDVLIRHDSRNVVETREGGHFVEFSREYAPDMGLTVCGEYDRDNLFRMEYYFPFFRGSKATTYNNVGIEQHLRTTSFAVACDDMRVGTTLIFQLTNASEYLRLLARKGDLRKTTTVSISALAERGTILLPVIKDQKKARIDSRQQQRQNDLFDAARDGDEEALESLTMQDIDAYSMISRRIQSEDIYTIVDTYLIPYGLECDLYNIMGDITEVNTVRNLATGERIVQLGLNCNDVPMDVCVNEKDLLGSPEVGRRFKGHSHFCNRCFV